MDISEIRCHNTRLLVDSYGAMARFADVLGRAHAQVGHRVGKNPTRNIGSKVAREIEQCTGKPRGWLDAYHVDSVEGLLPHDHQSPHVFSRLEEKLLSSSPAAIGFVDFILDSWLDGKVDDRGLNALRVTLDELTKSSRNS